MDNKKLNQKIEEIIDSFDGASKAMANPYLLTGINARLQKERYDNLWTQTFAFISRPLMAIFLGLILVLNVVIITQQESKNYAVISPQNAGTTKYDFAINVFSIYDVEN